MVTTTITKAAPTVEKIDGASISHHGNSNENDDDGGFPDDGHHRHTPQKGDDDNDDSSDTNSEDDEFADFITSKWQDGVETGLTITWPRRRPLLLGPNDPPTPTPPPQQHPHTHSRHCLLLSTQLQEDAIAPLFNGTQWAGTRVWKAAIVGFEYILKEYGNNNSPDSSGCTIIKPDRKRPMSSLLELGCGLGVPGMLWYMTQRQAWLEENEQQPGSLQLLPQPPRVVLTDQPSLLPQLRSNLVTNFGEAVGTGTGHNNNIQARSLSWSEQGILDLLEEEKHSPSFDICLNCDCIYEPLYGAEARRALTEVLRTMAVHSPRTTLVTSVERRKSDGVDTLLHDLAQSGVVETNEENRIPCVYRNEDDPHHIIEIYVTRGVEEEDPSYDDGAATNVVK